MARVSIITPLYNKGLYIAETIQSVLDQIETDWEMLILDNLSSDDGFEIAQSFDDPRIHFFTNPVRGPGATRNLGLEKARGEWILFLDADDLIETTFLEKLFQAAIENPSAQVIASPWKEFESGTELKKATEKLPGGYRGNTSIADTSIANTCWAIHAAITKRSWLGTIRWPSELDQFLAEDTAYWFRVVQGATVAYTDYAGALYRTQTADCRSDYDPDAWFEGNHKAIQSNVSYIKSVQSVLSEGQTESLVRLYSSLYLKSKTAGAMNTAEQALFEANRWMDEYSAKAKTPGFSMRLRKQIGIRRFEQLKGLFQPA